jgi:hypothetical protein
MVPKKSGIKIAKATKLKSIIPKDAAMIWPVCATEVKGFL